MYPRRRVGLSCRLQKRCPDLNSGHVTLCNVQETKFQAIVSIARALFTDHSRDRLCVIGDAIDLSEERDNANIAEPIR